MHLTRDGIVEFVWPMLACFYIFFILDKVPDEGWERANLYLRRAFLAGFFLFSAIFFIGAFLVV